MPNWFGALMLCRCFILLRRRLFLLFTSLSFSWKKCWLLSKLLRFSNLSIKCRISGWTESSVFPFFSRWLLIFFNNWSFVTNSLFYSWLILSLSMNSWKRFGSSCAIESCRSIALALSLLPPCLIFWATSAFKRTSTGVSTVYFLLFQLSRSDLAAEHALYPRDFDG